jgi:hypothetical protein
LAVSPPPRSAPSPNAALSSGHDQHGHIARPS